MNIIYETITNENVLPRPGAIKKFGTARYRLEEVLWCIDKNGKRYFTLMWKYIGTFKEEKMSRLSMLHDWEIEFFTKFVKTVSLSSVGKSPSKYDKLVGNPEDLYKL